MKRRSLRRDCSGQVIVISALLIALILLSTAMYVVQTEKNVPALGANENNVFPAYKQTTRNTLISALANITGGGDNSILTSDLCELNSEITSYSYQSILEMSYVPLNVAPYQNGVWVSWGSNGQGVSSVYVSFSFNSSSSSSTSNLAYDVNVTSQVNLAGSYSQLNDTSKQANLTVNLFNEGKPALAQSFMFYFENSTSWVNVATPNIIDLGNGTYNVSFTVEAGAPSDPLAVSMLCLDQRGISIGTNVTCNCAM